MKWQHFKCDCHHPLFAWATTLIFQSILYMKYLKGLACPMLRFVPNTNLQIYCSRWAHRHCPVWGNHACWTSAKAMLSTVLCVWWFWLPDFSYPIINSSSLRSLARGLLAPHASLSLLYINPWYFSISNSNSFLHVCKLWHYMQQIAMYPLVLRKKPKNSQSSHAPQNCQIVTKWGTTTGTKPCFPHGPHLENTNTTDPTKNVSKAD